MSINKTALDAALKEYYGGQGLTEAVFDAASRPMMSMLPKDESFVGDIQPFPVLYANSQGRAAGFSTAQANVSGSSLVRWQMDVRENHSVGQITNDALLRSRNDKGAYLKGAVHVVDTALNALADDIEQSLFRESHGARGTISSITSSVITLTDANDSTNFEVGMKLVFAANATSAARASGAAVAVTAVDRNAGTVTIASTPSGTVANDLIFAEGDYSAAGSTTLKISGFADWLPASAPGATAFYGVDRSVDTRLGGNRFAGSTSDIEGSIVEAAALTARESSGTPDVAVVSFTVFADLVKELQATIQRDTGAKTSGGYRYLEMYGPRGAIQVVPATHCQHNIIWLLTKKTWKIISMGPLVNIFDEDGTRLLRVSNAAALEVRAQSYANLVCSNPAANCRITLS